jgi:hypothetical protein
VRAVAAGALDREAEQSAPLLRHDVEREDHTRRAGVGLDRDPVGLADRAHEPSIEPPPAGRCELPHRTGTAATWVLDGSLEDDHVTVLLAVEVDAEEHRGKLPSFGPEPRELLLEFLAVELVALAAHEAVRMTVVVYSQVVIRGG